MAGPFGPPYRRGPRRGSAAWSTVLPIPAAPATPNTPSPADAATAYYTLLSWVAAGATKFDIYLDTVTPPVARAVPGHYVGTSYVPTLLPLTRYYWQIVAINDGGSATGPIWSFTTPAASAVIITRAGVDVTAKTRLAASSIHDVIGAAPNTASVIFDTAPTGGQAIQIGLGSLDAAALIFGGEVQALDQTYLGTPAASTRYPVRLIDHTFRLNKRRPFGTWTNTSATIIARYCIATFAPGFTATHVQDGLPAVSITFDGSQDFMTCMRALATAISTSTTPGQTKVDYSKDLHLFLTETTDPPDPLDRTHPPLNHPSPLVFSVDHSQIRTRVIGKGHGETVPCDVAAGETIVPIVDAVMFNPSGGQAIAGTTSGGAQSQQLTYVGVQLGGGGSLVGPGAAPSTAPTLTLAAGAGLAPGVYAYAVVDVTAAGKSLPSPIGTITAGAAVAAPPSSAPVTSQNPAAFALVGTDWAIGDSLYYVETYVTALGETAPSPVSNTVIAVTSNAPPAPVTINVSSLSVPSDPNVTSKRIYRNRNGNWDGYYQTGDTTSQGGSLTNASINWFDIGEGRIHPGSPPASTATANQVSVAGIALGASPTTSRELYRTAVQTTQAAALTAQLKLVTTIANNTSTGPYVDSTPDASLGANAPISDTSGLTQPSGQVNAGSPSLLLASAGPFQLNGGWVMLAGGQVVRYTGISGNTLTGIPISGQGAITTTVLYGSQITPAPALVGINAWNGLTLASAKGSKINIFVQRDDLAAQTALGLLERDKDGNPTDGIREYTITDERMGEAALIAKVDADLAQFSRAIVSAAYYTRDVKTKAGKTVPIALSVGSFDATFDPATFDVVTAWGLTGNFVIQSVDLTFTGPGTLTQSSALPLRRVQASSVSFSLSDLLRKVALLV